MLEDAAAIAEFLDGPKRATVGAVEVVTAEGAEEEVVGRESAVDALVERSWPVTEPELIHSTGNSLMGSGVGSITVQPANGNVAMDAASAAHIRAMRSGTFRGRVGY